MRIKTMSTEECEGFLKAVRAGLQSLEDRECVEECHQYARGVALRYYKDKVGSSALLATIDMNDFADDVCQEVVVRFLKRCSMGTIKCGQAKISTIIYGFSINVIKNMERKHLISSKRKADFVDPEIQGGVIDEPEWDWGASAEGSPSSAEQAAGPWEDPVINELVMQESRERLYRCMEWLTVQQRNVIDRCLENPEAKMIDIAKSLKRKPQRISQLRRQAEENLKKCLFRDWLLETLSDVAPLLEDIHESIGLYYAMGLLQTASNKQGHKVLVLGLEAGSEQALKKGAKLAVETQEVLLDELISEMWEKRLLQGIRDTEYGGGWKDLPPVQKRVLLLALHCDKPVIVERHRVRLRKEDKVCRDRR